jgi:hypothetical protein
LSNGRAVVALDRASPSADAVGMMVDDATGFAGLLIAHPGEAEAWAFKLGTTSAEAAFEMSAKKGAPRAELKVAESEAPAWKFSAATTSDAPAHQ